MSYGFRPAAPRDREAVFAFCATTWPNGDYIPRVWDAWLADPEGRFAVGVDAADSAVAVGKLGPAAPGEGWLQGIRVDPALRRGGWGRALTAHLSDCAWAQGMRTVRYLTDGHNTPMHHVAAALGFAAEGQYHPHRAAAGGRARLRLARPTETAALWADASAGGPLRWRGWVGAEASAAWFADAIARERVLVAADGRSFAVLMPPADGRDAEIALIHGATETFAELLVAARAWAAAADAAEIFALLPPAAVPAATADGWTTRVELPMWLYGCARPVADDRPGREAFVNS